MARIARIVVPGRPHLVTQWGNRQLETFFCEEDYQAYIELLAEFCPASGTKVWAYCLLPNHVHLILVPKDPDGLRGAVAEAHRRYTREINRREGWRGHLWQDRFQSFVMDEAHLALAARYVEQAPKRAGLVRQARHWPWSSAKAHLASANDELVRVKPLLKRFPDWPAYLKQKLSEEELERLRLHSRTGRPLGSNTFLTRLEEKLGRRLKRKPPGRPPKAG